MAALKNECSVMNPDKTFTMKTIPVPVPGKNEVLLAVEYCGLCGSDVHYWDWGGVGDIKFEKSVVIGHEGSGRVVQVGPSVKHLKIGDRVAIETSEPCGKCELCLTGFYQLCPDIICAGKPPTSGLFTKYFVHHADFCFKLPDNVSDEEGAVVEPLSVAVYACRKARVAAGDSVLICGAGPIGLLVMLVAKAMGAAKVIMTDMRQNRLDIAKSLGATHTKVADQKDEKKAAQEIRHVLGEAPAISFDCCGSEAILKTCIYATKSTGVAMVIGYGREETMSIPIVEAAMREIDIRGIFRYPNCYKRAIALIASGAVNVKPLITHKLKLSELPKAMEMAKYGTDDAIKILIKCQD